MTTTTRAEPTLDHANSHSVSEPSTGGRLQGINKEEVFTYWRTEWRGQPVSITMQASRYRVSVWENDKENGSQLTDWRVYATEARTNRDEHYAGEPVSDLARRRLSEQVSPLVHDWLDSEAYRLSERRAYGSMILHTLRDRRYDVVRETRRQLTQYEEKLSLGIVNRITRAINAYDTFARTFEDAEAYNNA